MGEKMGNNVQEPELINIPITVDVPYRFAAGKYLTRFLVELRDNGKFFGIRCPLCKRVQMPPRIVCAVCHVKNTDWVALGNEGSLVGFTIMYIPLTDPTTGKPHNPPFTYGSVRLDGADSVLDHLINIEPDVNKLRIGMRMRVVLRPQKERIGDLSDILFFEPVEDQKKPEE
jgi:uncharacterized OB-fold protein